MGLAGFGGLPILDKGADGGCTANKPCPVCHGDCDSDNDCTGDYKCFQRTEKKTVVPGCADSGYVKSTSDHDYCYNPADAALCALGA